jgi:hypothetical protein
MGLNRNLDLPFEQGIKQPHEHKNPQAFPKERRRVHRGCSLSGWAWSSQSVATTSKLAVEYVLTLLIAAAINYSKPS